MANPERWLPVTGYEEIYEVSSIGRVRRVKSMPNAPAGLIRKSQMGRDGYMVIGLSQNGVIKMFRINRLVAIAFLGPAPDDKPLVLHRNGDPLDNRIENLRWGDASENQKDSVEHGTHWEARMTECIRGHIFDEKNTYWDGKGKRSCKQCRRDASKRSRERCRARGLPGDSELHGTYRGYSHYACKCEDCKRAASERKRRYKREVVNE